MSITDRSTFIPGGRTGFLLIHGLGGTPIELHFVAQGLAREGYTVYCCQLAGHGGSKEELQNSTWTEWYRSVEDAHERLSQHCDTIIAGGLSMGAILALHLAHQKPDGVQGLALFAPTLRLDGWAMPWHSVILRWVRPTPLKIHMDLPEREPYGLKDERIRNFVVKSMLSGEGGQPQFFTPLRAFAHFNSLVDVVRRELPQIKTPALILHPRDDDMASIGNSLHIQRKLAGMVEMVVLEDSYHIITLDRQRHVVVEKSVAFARNLEAAIARKVGVKQMPVPGQRTRAE